MWGGRRKHQMTPSTHWIRAMTTTTLVDEFSRLRGGFPFEACPAALDRPGPGRATRTVALPSEKVQDRRSTVQYRGRNHIIRWTVAPGRDPYPPCHGPGAVSIACLAKRVAVRNKSTPTVSSPSPLAPAHQSALTTALMLACRR
jgi:hypothetical protein